MPKVYSYIPWDKLTKVSFCSKKEDMCLFVTENNTGFDVTCIPLHCTGQLAGVEDN